jgi:hypothetical protein
MRDVRSTNPRVILISPWAKAELRQAEALVFGWVQLATPSSGPAHEPTGGLL